MLHFAICIHLVFENFKLRNIRNSRENFDDRYSKFTITEEAYGMAGVLTKRRSKKEHISYTFLYQNLHSSDPFNNFLLVSMFFPMS